jgi:hypothetical protein
MGMTLPIDYSKCSIRQLKSMREYHRKQRKKERHHTLFKFINKTVKDKQAKAFEKQHVDFLSRFIAWMDKSARKEKLNAGTR